MTTTDIFANQRQIWKDYKDFYILARRALPFIVGVVIGGFIFASDEGYMTNLYTEIMSIIATVGILDFFYQRRDMENLKKRLVREAGSRSNETARLAINWLRTEGWLTGDTGLLQRANLWNANLQKAYLENANLQQAYLDSTNLQNANLRKANLQNANLRQANLQRADLLLANLTRANIPAANLQYAYLMDANLRKAFLLGSNLLGADLRSVNLYHAHLADANLQGARLTGANIEEAILRGVNLDNIILEEEILRAKIITILPDGNKWTPDTDMTRFTDPHHPDFWRPDVKDDE